MKRDKQYKDSALFAGIGMIGFIAIVIGMIIYNIVVNGIG